MPTHSMPGQKWPFKVIYFDVIQFQKALSDYILQCNNYGLVCESSEDIESEISKNHNFQ